MKDYQAEQMLELIHGGYDPELLWCDIGGPNDSLNVLSEYFNHSENRPKPRGLGPIGGPRDCLVQAPLTPAHQLRTPPARSDRSHPRRSAQRVPPSPGSTTARCASRP
ncbi:hypothetical protein ACFU8Q_28080 [Streptomyces sp. NPDC057543]|uniref:hypothetical protein n=1 Tax=Streptomyces sp. NPDC057543 TaxID=3346163 RepID=UPI0036BC7E65